MDERQLARGLGWFSLGLGLMEVTAPGRVSRFVGLKGQSNLVRLFGLREIASGVGILARPDPRGWVDARVAGDVMDLALLGSALAEDNPRRTGAAVATAAVAGVTALDLLCSRRLRQQDGTNGTQAVERSIIVNRPPEDLFRFWRGIERLPEVMQHLESVRITGPGRSHWVARGPGGYQVEWDSEVVADRPNEFLAWRSLEGGDLDHAGWVRFEPATGGRGTVVRVALEYRPPAGALGMALAKLMGDDPDLRMAVDLHRLKQLLETGEIARTFGQPAAREGASKYDEFVRT